MNSTLRFFGQAFGLGTLFLFSLTHCGDEPGEQAAEPRNDLDAAVDARRDRQIDANEPGESTLPPSPFEGGGTRFRPEYAEETYDDGSLRREFTGAFLDTQTQLRCSIQPVGDGRWACVPVDTIWVQRGFRDASCTEPVLFQTGRPEGGQYLQWGEGCSWNVGIANAPVIGTAYEQYDGRCIPRTNVAIHETPTPLTASAMGEFTRTNVKSELPSERSGTRLALFSDKFTGPDGSFVLGAPVVVDLDRDVEGGFYPGQDGKFHFLPASRWASESLGFVDDTCTEALVNLGPLPPSGCGATRAPSTNALQYVGDNPVNQCRPVRVVGAPTKPVVSTVYLELADSCSLMGYPGTDTYTKDSFVELPASESPETTQALVRSDVLAIHGAKIEFRATRTTSADGLDQTARATGAYLRDYGVPCRPALTAEGGRCLPDVAMMFRDRVYSDAACQQKVLRFETWTMTCDGDPTLYLIARDDKSPSFLYQAYRRPASSPLNQPTYYWLGEDGSCLPSPADPWSRYYAVTAADEPIPSTEFPSITVDYVVDL